jgi:nickel transport protein
MTISDNQHMPDRVPLALACPTAACAAGTGARAANGRDQRDRVRGGLGAALALLLTATVGVAAAHGLHLSAQPQADGIRGQAFYADGQPARREYVAVYGVDASQPLAESSTDADGRFSLPLAAAGTYRVVVEGDEGHRAETRIAWAPAGGSAVTASGSPSSAPANAARSAEAGPAAATAAPVDAAALAAAVRAEVAPLREDLARLEARVRLSDLIGGIGIVVGLAGAFALWRARRR